MATHRPSVKTAGLTLLVFLVISGYPALVGPAPSLIEVGAFSAQGAGDPLPAQWEPFLFKNIDRHTHYSLVEEEGRVVVRAEADASASGLIRKVAIDPKEYPIVQWRWKVANVLKNGDVYRKAGDDCPARIYIVFAYDPGRLSFTEKIRYEIARMFYGEYPPSASLTYIWASRAPRGTVLPNAFSARAMMIVVQSGERHLHDWLAEERDVYADYRQAFKEEPPMIAGVAIMSDTDNTGESAVAYYGDILFRRGR